VDYYIYIRSWQWRQTRLVAMAAAGNRCEKCGADYWLGNRLEVHHLHYRTLGNEQPGDIIVLCGPCHKKEHKIGSNGKIEKSKAHEVHNT